MSSRAFTLVEMLLALGLVMILTGIGAPILARFLTKNDLDTAVISLAQSWRRGQGLAMASEGDSRWGVRVSAGSIVLFKGATFAARETGYDESFDLPATILVSGAVTEVSFSKLTGTPSATGTVSLSNFADTASLTINSQGAVFY